MKPPPPTILYARMLVGLNALTWMAFGALVLISAHPSYAASEDLRLGMASAAFAVGAILWTLAMQLGRPRTIAFWATIALLGAAAVASFFDSLGPVDLAYAIVTIATIALLLRDRAWHLQKAS